MFIELQQPPPPSAPRPGYRRADLVPSTLEAWNGRGSGARCSVGANWQSIPKPAQLIAVNEQRPRMAALSGGFRNGRRVGTGAVRASPSTLLKCSMRATCQDIFSLSWFLYDLLLLFALV